MDLLISLSETWTSTDGAKFQELCARFDEVQLLETNLEDGHLCETSIA